MTIGKLYWLCLVALFLRNAQASFLVARLVNSIDVGDSVVRFLMGPGVYTSRGIPKWYIFAQGSKKSSLRLTGRILVSLPIIATLQFEGGALSGILQDFFSFFFRIAQFLLVWKTFGHRMRFRGSPPQALMAHRCVFAWKLIQIIYIIKRRRKMDRNVWGYMRRCGRCRKKEDRAKIIRISLHLL